MELTFDEVKHVYRLDGVVIPSVTTLMKPLSAAMYDGIDEETLNKAAEKGTIVHNAIEDYVKYGFDVIPEEQAGYFEAYKSFAKDYKIEPIENEKRIYHKALRYAGTADCIAKIDGKITLIDFKTTSVLMPMLTRVQLEAYKKALESMGYKVEAKMIVQLKKDGKYKIELHELNDLEAWTVFAALQTCNNFINKYKK